MRCEIPRLLLANLSRPYKTLHLVAAAQNHRACTTALTPTAPLHSHRQQRACVSVALGSSSLLHCTLQLTVTLDFSCLSYWISAHCRTAWQVTAVTQHKLQCAVVGGFGWLKRRVHFIDADQHRVRRNRLCYATVSRTSARADLHPPQLKYHCWYLGRRGKRPKT